jgi:hypothetical protein
VVKPRAAVRQVPLKHRPRLGEQLFGAWLAGRYSQSIELHEQTLAERTRVLGPDHPRTLNPAVTSPLAIGRVGRYDEAVTLWEQTLIDMTRVLSPAIRTP